MNDISIKPGNSLPVKNPVEERDNKLKEACKQFESVFVYEMLKSMRNSIPKTDLFSGGQAEEIYQSMLDQELSKNMAGQGSNSIANILYQQLKAIEEKKGNTDSLSSNNSGLPVWPLEARISSSFGWRNDPFTGERKFHEGIDLAAEEGADVKAIMAGRVQMTDDQKGYGKVVVLDHGNGFSSLYAHNSDITVKAGDWITKGSTIARVGSTGRSTGPHLHFEVRKDGEKLDPEKFLRI
ncbi:MAG: peptidoglycan DD-metalloendopeptidase family protein [Deltaproteobacteria bacterium]|nr:peptidoglycan DD-metalloendopeptidase family protein [Deltaproteobacteria bacterium]